MPKLCNNTTEKKFMKYKFEFSHNLIKAARTLLITCCLVSYNTTLSAAAVEKPEKIAGAEQRLEQNNSIDQKYKFEFCERLFVGYSSGRALDNPNDYLFARGITTPWFRVNLVF
jgi:hypothetical protein